MRSEPSPHLLTNAIAAGDVIAGRVEMIRTFHVFFHYPGDDQAGDEFTLTIQAPSDEEAEREFEAVVKGLRRDGFRVTRVEAK